MRRALKDVGGRALHPGAATSTLGELTREALVQRSHLHCYTN